MTGTGTAAASQLAVAGPSRPPPSGHVVQFYEAEPFLVHVACEFISAGLVSGEQILVIATRAHIDAFSTHLRGRGCAVELAIASGQLTFVDAHHLLERFLVNDSLDRNLFREQMEHTFAALPPFCVPRRLRVYGEMVDVLSRRGNLDAACHLEAAWSELCAKDEFTVLCTYDLGSFQLERNTVYFDEICRHHTHVAPSERYLSLPDAPSQLREIARLQQRERVHRAIEEELRLTVNREREARARAEASQAFKELFLGVLGHDLRNPLSAILNTARLMSMQRGLDPEVDKRVARLLSSSERMQRMIEQILDATRTRLTAGIGLSLAEPRDIVPLVDELVQEFRTAHANCRFELHAPMPCLARIDDQRFAQVLQNLLDNAVTHGDPQHPIGVFVSTVDGTACVRVHNFGQHITEDALAHLFDPFVRGSRPGRRSAGLGLGLYISQHVVRAHGGNITVESSERDGTRFEIRLPIP